MNVAFESLEAALKPRDRTKETKTQLLIEAAEYIRELQALADSLLVEKSRREHSLVHRFPVATFPTAGMQVNPTVAAPRSILPNPPSATGLPENVSVLASPASVASGTILPQSTISSSGSSGSTANSSSDTSGPSQTLSASSPVLATAVTAAPSRANASPVTATAVQTYRTNVDILSPSLPLIPNSTIPPTEQ